MLMVDIASMLLPLAGVPIGFVTMAIIDRIATFRRRGRNVRKLCRQPGDLCAWCRYGFGMTVIVIHAERCPFTGQMLLLSADRPGTLVDDEHPGSVDPIRGVTANGA